MKRREPKEKTYSEKQLLKFFKMQEELKSRVRKIANLCTNITTREEVTGFWCDEDPKQPCVGLSVWSQDCGNDCYWFPLEYLSMTLDEVKEAMKPKRRKRS